MPQNRTSPAASAKSARLEKWGDDNDSGDFDGGFGGGSGDFLAQLNESNVEVLSPADEYDTLKFAPMPLARGLSPGLSPSRPGLGPSAGDDVRAPTKDSRVFMDAREMRDLRDLQDVQDLRDVQPKDSKQMVTPSRFARFVENDDDDMSFGEDVQFGTLQRHPHPTHASHEFRLSPESDSLTSPIRRRSLSDFSEDTDTDITEINDDDFEEIDDIFGKEESGLYSSGGKRLSKKAAGTRAREILLQRRQQLEEQAQAEDDELFKRYKTRREQAGGPFMDNPTHEVNTLKLKDLSLHDRSFSRQRQDPLENDLTINYEYTRDDLETFEDGFVGDLPSIINQEKLSHFHTPVSGPGGQISRKASMPVFPRSLKASRPTKFKSTMDLGAAFGQRSSEHPLFNNNNKIIRKLDRMPSFHIKTTQAPPHNTHIPPPPINEDLLHYNMELHKKQLLEKYMEISKKQFQLRSSPKKKSSFSQQQHSKPSRKGIGTLKCLNNKSSAPFMAGNKQMKFNSDSNTWEGNEHDLLRFDEYKDDGVLNKKQKQPSLITRDQFRHQGDTVKGNMIYDSENLKWVNKDAMDEQQENVFEDLPDLVPNDIPQYSSPAPASLKPPKLDRGVSTFTQRTISTNSNASSMINTSTAGEEFTVSAKLMSRFEKEEAKIKKKTHHWFGPNETYHLSRRDAFDADYFWEIRKMVMDNDN